MTFRAMVDSQHKSPLKKRRMQSSSDAIQQEVTTDLTLSQTGYLVIPVQNRTCSLTYCLYFLQFMDLRTRYTALVTLMTQYVKFASETLKRTEDEEVRDSYFLDLQLLMQHTVDVCGFVAA